LPAASEDEAMAKLNLALVGAGFMGRFHAQAIAECDGARLAAVIDLAEAAGRPLAEAWGAAYLRDAEAGLGRGDLDGFVVALPDRLHEAVTCRLLEAGKPVLLEKPMAHSLAAARAIAASERKGGRLLVGHILRFDPRYVEAAAAVREGRIGQPIHASSGRFTVRDIGTRMNGTSSVCFYLGVHDVDALQWITGREIRGVYSRAVSKLMPSLGVTSEDAIFTTCEMTDGMVGQLHSGWSLPSDVPTGIWARTEVIGTEGLIDLDVRDHGLRTLSRSAWRLPDGLHWPTVNGRIMGDLHEEIRHFAQAIRDDLPFVVPVADALRAVAVNDAILRSVASGRVELVEDWRA
jgi:myo-inositol 2-dehydrogenase/D-chiro-inositol 1-dehydrogenase